VTVYPEPARLARTASRCSAALHLTVNAGRMNIGPVPLILIPKPACGGLGGAGPYFERDRPGRSRRWILNRACSTSPASRPLRVQVVVNRIALWGHKQVWALHTER
jgi:hypothetical protein